MCRCRLLALPSHRLVDPASPGVVSQAEGTVPCSMADAALLASQPTRAGLCLPGCPAPKSRKKESCYFFAKEIGGSFAGEVHAALARSLCDKLQTQLLHPGQGRRRQGSGVGNSVYSAAATSGLCCLPAGECLQLVLASSKHLPTPMTYHLLPVNI